MHEITVAPAAEEDVHFLAESGGAMFASSHQEAMRPEDVAVYLKDAFDPDRILRHIQRADNAFLVARVGDERTGYARVLDGPRSPLIAEPDVAELRRLYVLDAWHGTGVAAALMDGVVRASRAWGKSVCWLHVWEGNHRAIRFYEKSGFRAVGREESPYRNSRPMTLVMERTITAD